MTSHDWLLGGCPWSWRDSPAGDKGLTRKLQGAQLSWDLGWEVWGQGCRAFLGTRAPCLSEDWGQQPGPLRLIGFGLGAGMEADSPAQGWGWGQGWD